MSYLASLANLGSMNIFSLGNNCDGNGCLVRRVSFNCYRGSKFKIVSCAKGWRYTGICRYSVMTNHISEQRTLVSLSLNVNNDADAVLKAAPKSFLKSKIDHFPNRPWDETEVNGSPDDESSGDSEERRKIIDSLGEVLEKAEKLETSKKVNDSVKKPVTNESSSQIKCKPANSVGSGNRKSKTMKSVWRKGNPVASVQKFVGNEPKKEEPETNGQGLNSSQDVSSFRQSQLPQKVQPKLQAKHSIAPPVRKPALKDVNAASESVADEKPDEGTKPKERKPILIDKFASKKPMVNPLVAQAVLAPRKPGKGPPPGKFKDNFRKKGDPSSGVRRRPLDKDDDDTVDEDAAELIASMGGTSTARKGRKWTKKSRKAARLKVAKDAAPVRVEIMEVDEDGMLTEELAFNLAISEGEILGYLYSKGISPDGVTKLSKDMVKIVCKEYKVEVIDALSVKLEEMAKKKFILDEDDLDKLEDRPPVLTIMGHVDHGKTTLLDNIRNSKVAAGEAGGITQGIGAYKVQVPVDGKNQTCVFLDTPGHEAFGAMRARGARVTDIAVIVVAADDGIRPQTNEAIAHARAAKVPIVVAINKIDKDGANPNRVIQELSSIGLMPDEWGGDTQMVKISALKGENVDALLETVILVAEFQELKANPHRNAKGTVIEAGRNKSKGPVATFIVQNGTLKKGNVVVCGGAYGKVRALFDDNGKQVDEAGPSIPVQVTGLSDVPLSGDEFEVVRSIDIAREKAEERAEYLRNEHLSAKAGGGMITLSSLASAVSTGINLGLDLHQLNVILKVDLQGSIEAVRQALQVLPQDNVTLKFLLLATGDVSTSDVELALASKAVIFGFNVKAPGSVKSYADNKGVEIRFYRVIYELIEDVRNAMEGLLDPVAEQVPIGSAEVRAVFSSGSGRVAGCMVTEGKVVEGCGVRVLRKGKQVHIGALTSLKRVKEIVKEVNAGLECGIGIENHNDWEVGDVIEAFNTVQKKRTLEEASSSMSAAVEEVTLQLEIERKEREREAELERRDQLRIDSIPRIHELNCK